MKLIIDIPEKTVNEIKDNAMFAGTIPSEILWDVTSAIVNGIPLPKGHGRLGDLDELEQRISNFVEHDAKITDEYTVVRQRFIVDGIRQTPTIIEADKAESEDKE